jgi:hypothetical protein
MFNLNKYSFYDRVKNSMHNKHLPGREEVYLAVQISIIASRKLHRNHKLAYNLFPSRAYSKILKKNNLFRALVFYIYKTKKNA